MQCKTEIFFLFVPCLVKIFIAPNISFNLDIPVDSIIFLLDFPIFSNNGTLVISPEGILIVSTFNLINSFKLFSSNGEQRNLIFFLMQ